MLRKTLFLALIVTAPAAYADFSGNLGWQSHYIYRGIPQSTSSAQGGVDFENGGFYLGTWAADVGMGAEVDVYGGYGWTVEDFSFGIGATGYYYTDKFDDTYTELNLSAGYKILTIDYATGEYENFAGPTQDYTFVSGTLELDNGLFGIYGSFGDQFDGDYFTAGYNFEVNGLDVSAGWTYTSTTLGSGTKESNIFFGIGKSFDLNKK